MAEWIVGSGFYQWRDLDGNLNEGNHWDDLPDEMDTLVAFIPTYPEGPHTQAQHEAMGTFNDKLQEAISRCRR